MFERKLIALDHPNPNNIDPNNQKEYRCLVLWLEDQKIRHYKIEDRENLRKIDSKDWQNAFSAYIQALACPVQENKLEILEWLLSFAVRLEYSDNVDKYITASNTNKKSANTPNLVSKNPLDNLDFFSNDFKSGVNSLAKLLSIPYHPDHLITLKAISKVVNKRLTSTALENPNNVIVKGVPIPLEVVPLGMNSQDQTLNQAAKILRLLYIQNLRELQTVINESVVAVQSVTANPKTDTKLGKVGF